MLKDEKILKRLSLGDDQLFKDIYKLYYNDLCRYVYIRFIRDKNEAEEIVQNLIVKLWEKRNNLPQIKSIKSYLFKTAFNASVNYLEHKAVENKYKNSVDYKLKQMEIIEPDNMNFDERVSKIMNKINELPEQTKRIIKLKYIEGLKYKEIANQLDISSKTVQTLIYRGLKQLRSSLIFILVCILFKFSFLFNIYINCK